MLKQLLNFFAAAFCTRAACLCEETAERRSRRLRQACLQMANREKLPKLTLSAGEPLLKDGKLSLKSGKYYEIEIEADGSQELASDRCAILSLPSGSMRSSSMASKSGRSALTAWNLMRRAQPKSALLPSSPALMCLSVPGSDTQKVEIIIE